MGYAARGIIYLTIGALAFSSAMGWEGDQTGSKGAILSLKSQPFGEILLALLVVGLIGYIIWRLIQGITDTDDHGHSIKGMVIRAGLILSAVTHSVLTYWVIKLLLKKPDNSSAQSASSTMSKYLDADITSLVFGLAGLILIGVGFAHLFKGFTSRFKKYIEFPEDKSRWLVPICQFGLIARGVVWCIIGWIILRSAFVSGTSDNKGIDDAFQWLNTTPFGTSITIIVALGLFAFGVYSFVESLYRRIEK